MHTHSPNSVDVATRSLFEHITADENIARFTLQAQRLLNCQRQLETALPHALRPHVRIANLRAGKLVVYAANAAVASKIRQLAPRLATIFANQRPHVSEIDVRVQADMWHDASKSQQTPVPKPLPSLERQAKLAELTATLTNDSAMKAPLERLLKALKSR